MGITKDLAEFVASSSYSELPEEVVYKVKLHLLDALACGFLGSRLRWAQLVAEMVGSDSGNKQASVFGMGNIVNLSQAALLNGVMISGFEGDHSGHISHNAATVTPAALAIGEWKRASGSDVIASMALASEVGCRIGDGLTRQVEEKRGFHNPGVNGPIVAAAAAGRILGLDSLSQARAFGIAASHSGGLVEYAWDGAMTKRLHLGRASQRGVESALLAAKGFTGPTTVIEGRFGLLNAFSPTPDQDVILSDLGSIWRLKDTRIKPYAVHGTSIGIVAAIQALKARDAIVPAEISSVEVSSSDHRVLHDRFLNRAPVNLLGAQCSVPFTAAVALCRNLDDPLQYDVSVLSDPLIKRLADLVSVDILNTGTKAIGASVTVTSRGAESTARVGPYIGSAAKPATFEDIEDKFHRYSSHIIDLTRRQMIVDTVRNLDNLRSIGELCSALRGR